MYIPERLEIDHEEIVAELQKEIESVRAGRELLAKRNDALRRQLGKVRVLASETLNATDGAQ